MTSGLEWNLKGTAREMPHILERFVAEFDTYWHSREFQDHDIAAPARFREAIARERNRTGPIGADTARSWQHGTAWITFCRGIVRTSSAAGSGDGLRRSMQRTGCGRR